MSWMVWIWGGLCGAAVVGVAAAAAGGVWFVRRRAAAAAPAETAADAIDVALMESLAQMMLEAEAGDSASPRAGLARDSMKLATANRREELLAKVAAWEGLGGKAKEPKAFNDMKRALR